MKLSKETLLQVLDIFRRGIIESRDMSQDLRDLDLWPGSDGLLYVAKPTDDKGQTGG